MPGSTVSLLGCGWLGLELGKHLVQHGFRVNGSVTRLEKLDGLSQAGITPFQFSLDPDLPIDLPKGFLDVDLLIIGLPPLVRTRTAAFHPGQMQLLLPQLEETSIRQVIYFSSTSVYPALSRELTEEDDYYQPNKPSGQAIREAEKLLQNGLGPRLTIFRLGGLVGPGRQPGYFLAGKKDLSNPDHPINLVHREDIIGAVDLLIEQSHWGGIFNLCCPQHPTRETFYQAAAQSLGLVPPEFAPPGTEAFKLISGEKITRELGYTYRHSDPMDWVT